MSRDPARATIGAPMGSAVSSAQFANGVRALVIPMPNVHRVTVEARLRIGPRYESLEQNGISHLLEHMLYRGTPTYPSPDELALGFESLGGELAALTGVDHGALSLRIPPENLEAGIRLFAEVYQHPIYEGLATEKGLVREEILEGLDEHGKLIDPDDLVRAQCFGGHALGYPITGTLDRLEALAEPDLRLHHHRYYVGANTVVAVAGPVSSEPVLPQLERAFGGLIRGARPQAAPPGACDGPRWQFVQHPGSQTALRICFRGPGWSNPMEPAAAMLLRILDDGMSTRLYRRICSDKGLCYDVSASKESYEDAGLFDIAASTEHENAAEVLSEMLSIVAALAQSPPSTQELDKARARLRWQTEEMLDHVGAVAEYYTDSWLADTRCALKERCSQLWAVEQRQICDAAASIFAARNLCVCAVGTQPRAARAALEQRVRAFG